MGRSSVARTLCPGSGGFGDRISSKPDLRMDLSTMFSAGGSGEPPPAPPRESCNIMLRSPNGQAEVADWYAGYRVGADVAHDGGYRERVTLQSSVPLGPPDIALSVPLEVAPLVTPSGAPLPPDLDAPDIAPTESAPPGAIEVRPSDELPRPSAPLVERSLDSGPALDVPALNNEAPVDGTTSMPSQPRKSLHHRAG